MIFVMEQDTDRIVGALKAPAASQPFFLYSKVNDSIGGASIRRFPIDIMRHSMSVPDYALHAKHGGMRPDDYRNIELPREVREICADYSDAVIFDRHQRMQTMELVLTARFAVIRADEDDLEDLFDEPFFIPV